MRYGGLDLETTGLDQANGDRIVEIGLLLYDDEELVEKWVRRVNPERNIPVSAIEVHGITPAMVLSEPPFDALADELVSKLATVDKLIIHNADFDIPFLMGELTRVRRRLARPLQTYCTMKNGRWATYDGKSPRVKELCFALGIEFDPLKAHSAEYDIVKTMEAYFAGKKGGWYE